jgi:hypothetical protein
VSEEVVVGTRATTRHGMPTVRAPSVARRSLFGLLSAGGRGGITLVSAPAGSGKTIDIAHFVGAPWRRCWCSVSLLIPNSVASFTFDSPDSAPRISPTAQGVQCRTPRRGTAQPR